MKRVYWTPLLLFFNAQQGINHCSDSADLEENKKMR
jgi:hypothetical protein